MQFISEDQVRKRLDRRAAFEAVESCFAAMANGEASNFPVVRVALGHKDALFGCKSGYDASKGALGLKLGGYWPHNHRQDLTNHQSVVVIVDPETGQAEGVVAGNHLTAMRTAAASAVSIDRLARQDAARLAIIGAGHQAAFQIRAATAVRAFSHLMIWNRTKNRAEELRESLADLDIEIAVGDLEETVRSADVLITMTSCHEPLVRSDWVAPGTHIAAMGTDTAGKQELDIELVARCRVFVDEPGQAVSIGECQHAAGAGRIAEGQLVRIGDVINGKDEGRRSDDELTLFDSTGVGLQDVAVARQLLQSAFDSRQTA